MDIGILDYFLWFFNGFNNTTLIGAYIFDYGKIIPFSAKKVSREIFWVTIIKCIITIKCIHKKPINLIIFYIENNHWTFACVRYINELTWFFLIWISRIRKIHLKA